MNKHTPGPWVKVNCSLLGSDKQEVIAANLGLGLGADSGDGVRLANARLIAAAPDLLEALRDLISAEGLPEGYADRKALIEAARAAIAKAGAA